MIPKKRSEHLNPRLTRSMVHGQSARRYDALHGSPRVTIMGHEVKKAFPGQERTLAKPYTGS
jgi:hypothetical protein